MMINPEQLKDFLGMYESLRESINEAGGSGNSFRVEKLSEMTVIELITMLATNKIRFTYVGKEKE